MLTDTKIIHEQGPWAVLAQRYEVQFGDGQMHWLHEVRGGGCDQRFKRALVQKDRIVLFDLRSVAIELSSEIPQAPTRDVTGIVFFTLRARYATGAAFVRRVLATAEEEWALPGADERPLAAAQATAACAERLAA